jgi:hypothetical protein
VKLIRTSTCSAALAVLATVPAALVSPSLAQTTASLTQTVNQRNTIGVLTASPSTGLTAGQTVTFSYTLHTAGAPAPTTETVQFYDNGSAIGSAQAITSANGSNLLPYSQVATANGWTTTGTAPTVTPNSVNGPDGSTNTATLVAAPSTTSSTSGVAYAVPGTAYANTALTLSVWARTASTATLTLGLTDSPVSTASSTTTCALTSSWQRCTLTYAFPANAGTGFAAALSVAGQAAENIYLWGAQVEAASTAGPYVSTIGTARPTGGYGGVVSYAYSAFHTGAHSITVVYSGDTNFVSSTSNAVALTVAKATPGIALSASPVSPTAYGTAVTLTATLTGPAANPTDLPTGTVQFYDGATSLGSGTVNGSGVAALTLTGASYLAAGSHSITAVYGGDTEFITVTSSTLTYTVTSGSAPVTTTFTSSKNPSIYGDAVTFSVTVAGAGATPTGTVTVVDTSTSTTLGTITLTGGSGTLTLSSLTAGTHNITATYSGDTNYQ